VETAQSRAGSIATKCTARVSPGSAPSTWNGPVTGLRYQHDQADAEPDEAEDLCGDLCVDDDVSEDEETEHRYDQVAQPVPAAVADDVVHDDRYVQGEEGGHVTRMGAHQSAHRAVTHQPDHLGGDRRRWPAAVDDDELDRAAEDAAGRVELGRGQRRAVQRAGRQRAQGCGGGHDETHARHPAGLGREHPGFEQVGDERYVAGHGAEYVRFQARGKGGRSGWRTQRSVPTWPIC
jgi:hypothetical protein